MTKEIRVKVPDWVSEDFVKLQIERIVRLEERKKELIEETLRKLDLGEEDLNELEKVRETVWGEEKKRISLK